MMRALLCVALLAAGAARAADRPLPHSVDITLPDTGLTLPPGPGQDVVLNNCVGCHSPDFIAQQPLQPPAVWGAVVAKMRKVMKAPISDADATVIVAYLTAVKGAH
jgi:sulfite dehydrogenase (cytochrome) subunit B